MQQWSDYLDGLEGRGENITIRLKKRGKLVEFLKKNKGIWGLVIQAPFFIASQEISFDTPTIMECQYCDKSKEYRLKCAMDLTYSKSPATKASMFESEIVRIPFLRSM